MKTVLKSVPMGADAADVMSRLLSLRILLTLGFVGAVTLLVALTTAVGPIVLVLSHEHSMGIHVGDLAAMAMSFTLAMAVNRAPVDRLRPVREPAAASA